MRSCFGVVRRLRFLFAFILLNSFIFTAHAQIGDLIAQIPVQNVSHVLKDSATQRMYVSASNPDQILVIDMNTNTVINSIPVGPSPSGLAISEDGNTLYIASSQQPYIEMIDLQNMQPVGGISMPAPMYDVAISGNFLYATPANTSFSNIMMANLDFQYFWADFSDGVQIYQNGLLRLSPDKNILYFANTGISPGTLASFDIQRDYPVLQKQNLFGSLGSNGQDLALTADGQFISYVTGSGNNQGQYDVAKLTTYENDFSPVGFYVSGPYPEQIAYNPDGLLTYIHHEDGAIDFFDNYFIEIGSIATPPSPVTELILNDAGSQLYAVLNDGIYVYAAINTTIPVDQVFFNDPAMQQCLLEQTQQNGWQFVEDVTTFVCSGRGVFDVYGIDQFPRLKTLDLSNNVIDWFFPGSPEPLASLRELDLSNNNLIALGDLMWYSDLRKLNVSNNPIDPNTVQYDFAQLYNLTHLGVAGLAVQNLGFIPAYNPQTGQPTPLQELDVSATRLVDLNGIQQFNNLTGLNISDTQIFDLFPLSSTNNQITKLAMANIPAQDLFIVRQIIQQNPGLVELDLSGWTIERFSDLQIYPPPGGDSPLRSLKLANTAMSDVSGIEIFINLAELDLSNNNIFDIQPLMSNNGLEKLNLSNNSQIHYTFIDQLIRNNSGLSELAVANINVGNIFDAPVLAQNGQPLSFTALDLTQTGLAQVTGIAAYPELKLLKVANNRIIDVIPLAQLTNLQEIDLSYNPVYNEQDIIQALQNKPGLQKLSLAGLPVTSNIAGALFDNQAGRPYPLVALNLSATRLADMAFIDQYRGLQELDLSHNLISNVYGLENLLQLKKLNLNGNTQLEEYSLQNSFNNLRFLTHLKLSRITLWDFSSLNIDYMAMDRMIELDLSHTGIEWLNLNNYRSLQVLNISGNRLMDLVNLGPLDNLRELYASNNPLQYLSLPPIYRLKKLDLSYNNFIDLFGVDNLLNQNQDLESVNLAGLPYDCLACLPFVNDPYRREKIKELDLSDTRISNLAGLEQLTRLRSLKIANTLLNDASPIFNLSKIEELDLSNTQIPVDPSIFNNYFNLKKLNMSGNTAWQTNDLFQVLQNNPGLTQLGLADIQIGDLGQLPLITINGGPLALTHLDISNTGLNSVTALNDFPLLRSLNVSQNDLISPYGMENLGMLQELNMAETGLSSLSFIVSPNLRKLDISDNLQFAPQLLSELYQIIIMNPGLRSLAVANMGIADLYTLELPPAPPGSWGSPLVELVIDRNPLTSLQRLWDLPYLRVLSVRDLLPPLQSDPYQPPIVLDLNPLIAPIKAELIDIRGNTNWVCSEIDLVVNNYPFAEFVFKRPESCLPSRAPEAMIFDPIDGSIFDEGMPIFFGGHANDYEDGWLGPQMQWSSNIDGVFGTGDNFQATLSAGNHVITASVTDSDGTTTVSNAINLTINPYVPLQYCPSKGDSTYYEWIQSINLNGQLADTGNNNGYLDNTAYNFNVQRGGSYPMVLNPGYRRGAYYENWKVWVDFNKDGQFTPDEQIVNARQKYSVTQSITIPTYALTGKTTMRVTMSWHDKTDPCGDYRWGETEDYTVNIQ